MEEAERTGTSSAPAPTSAASPAASPRAASAGDASAAAADRRIAQLQQLADLHTRGVLSDADFATEKARVLSET